MIEQKFILGNVVLRIVRLVGKARKEKHFVTYESEAVAESRAWRIARNRRLRSQFFPFPFCRLK